MKSIKTPSKCESNKFLKFSSVEFEKQPASFKKKLRFKESV